MKLSLAFISVIILAGVVIGATRNWFRAEVPPAPISTPNPVTLPPSRPLPVAPPPASRPTIAVVASNFKIPWDLAFLPEGGMLVTERAGNLIYLSPTGEKTNIPLTDVRTVGESGLLGITLHPNFATNHWVYLYLTQAAGSGLINKVERYVYENQALSQPKTIINNIPGALYHDGGRMEFGPDGRLYITTGDATNENLAQNRESLAGKLLRLNDDGSIPADNPFGTAIYSWGHRNAQGLAWDATGQLWSTEHGRSGVLSGLDEINLIHRGANYGWPTIEGDKIATGLEKPTLHSGASDTWAPASLLYFNNHLIFGGLRGEAIFTTKVTSTQLTNLTKHFFKEYGRIRTIRLGPDGMIYFTTSNRDDRGEPKTGDDKIIKVSPAQLFNN